MNIVTNNRKIKICDLILNTMKKYLQVNSEDLEAGGVLIGKENMYNNDLVIEFITEPLKNDKRKRNRFHRKDKGHLDIFKTLHRNNFETYAYLGEWHTHPESEPNYSSIDYSNWKKIGKSAPYGVIHYHIIAGYDAFRIWEYNISKKKINLIKTIFWKDVN